MPEPTLPVRDGAVALDVVRSEQDDRQRLVALGDDAQYDLEVKEFLACRTAAITRQARQACRSAGVPAATHLGPLTLVLAAAHRALLDELRAGTVTREQIGSWSATAFQRAQPAIRAYLDSEVGGGRQCARQRRAAMPNLLREAREGVLDAAPVAAPLTAADVEDTEPVVVPLTAARGRSRLRGTALRRGAASVATAGLLLGGTISVAAASDPDGGIGAAFQQVAHVFVGEPAGPIADVGEIVAVAIVPDETTPASVDVVMDAPRPHLFEVAVQPGTAETGTPVEEPTVQPTVKPSPEATTPAPRPTPQRGSSASAPGQTKPAPVAGTPGRSSAAPGQTKPAPVAGTPGRSSAAPGRTRPQPAAQASPAAAAPGKSSMAPGQVRKAAGTSPSASAPGRVKKSAAAAAAVTAPAVTTPAPASPGRSGTAPGHVRKAAGTGPSASAPGQAKKADPAASPGRSASAPGQQKKNAGRS